ncbi:MAG: helix-turn-helix transcriptional regulator [Thermomicrobium sp.]|nr:helix-turn-helix transcriptional regulator [Thermomicrobium sp.]MDW8060011.1 helix-turn-helix transcriptional regulator [Thermomicrobium sp.]
MLQRLTGPGKDLRPQRPTVTLFGAELRALRESRGLSQSALGRRAGLDHSFISRLEAGGRQASREVVERIARALGLDEAERARLLHRAGYRADVTLDAAFEAALVALERVLADETLAYERRAQLARLVHELVVLCRGAS